MGHTRDETTQHLAERWGGPVARRDEARGARRLERQPVVEGVYRLEAGAVLEDFWPCVQSLGGLAWFEHACGAAVHRAMGPCVQSVWRDGLQPRLGMERLTARPRLRCRAEARRPWVGCKAPQGRHGICQRGATTRQGERAPGPRGPETLATHLGPWHVRDLECVGHGAMRAVATAGVWGAKVTGRADGTALDPTAHDAGCGHVTRTVRLEDRRGNVQAIEVMVYGGNVRWWIEAVTKMPLAVNVGPMQAHEARWARAWVTPARLHRAGDARLATVVCDQGLWDGTTRWWLDQPGIRVVVPATKDLAGPAEARAPAAAGEARTGGRRGPTVRHGQGTQAWSARREPAGVGLTGRPTDDP